MKLESVQYYKYLGLQFHISGKFDIARQDLADRSLKAMYKLTTYFKNIQPSYNTCIHLFDRVVKPVMMYASDISGIKLTKYSSLYKEMRSDVFEKCHLQFCRFIIGVNRRTPIIGIYGDTGRYPMYLTAMTSFVKYWYRLTKCDGNQPLLYNAFMHNTSNNTSWLKTVKKCLVIGDVTFKDAHKRSIGSIIRKITLNLRSEFRKGWKSELESDDRRKENCGNKLRTYRTFKSEFGVEQYLLKCNNMINRKNISRLRLSSHKLHIETGRMISGKSRLKAEDRLCKHCDKNECEDELHFILNCPLYKNERSSLLHKLSGVVPNFDNLTDKKKLIAVMTCSF